MDELYTRTSMLIGADKTEILKNSTVAIFGVGGVGGFAAEAIARAGVGTIHLIDKDVVSDSNRNRQIVALTSTIGQYKAEVMKARILDINPTATVYAHNVFYLPENASDFDFSAYDYVIDAVDNVTAKISIITSCNAASTPVISCMGTGNKLHPEMLKISDIYKTSVCPLARVMRKEMRDRGVKKLKVLFSEETPNNKEKVFENGKAVPASISFVPSVAGLMIAGEVIRDITDIK